MTKRNFEPDIVGWHAPPEDTGSASPTYVVRLRRDLRTPDVTRLLHYITDFGRGDARVHASDSGWAIHLTRIDDVRLISSQCSELLEGRIVGTSESSHAA